LFPDDYVLSTSQSVWGCYLGCRLGRITFATGEPPTLVYDSEQLATARCTRWITIEGHPANLHRLRACSIKVDPVLQIRTYYSTTELAGTPSRESIKESGQARPHTDTIQLDVHSVSSMSWTTKEARRGGTVSSATLHASGESGRDGCRRRKASEEESEPWYAAVSCPIKSPLKLQPSFCSDYVASSYAITVKVSIGGVCAKSARLLFPLQVAYPCPARRNSEHAGAEGQRLELSPLP
jgi:hypothetical protein